MPIIKNYLNHKSNFFEVLICMFNIKLLSFIQGAIKVIQGNGTVRTKRYEIIQYILYYNASI